MHWCTIQLLAHLAFDWKVDDKAGLFSCVVSLDKKPFSTQVDNWVQGIVKECNKNARDNPTMD